MLPESIEDARDVLSWGGPPSTDGDVCADNSIRSDPIRECSESRVGWRVGGSVEQGRGSERWGAVGDR